MKEYQKEAWELAIYPNKGNNIYYPALGLSGEVGEIANKVKKIMRDDNGVITSEAKESIVAECGDVLWYLAALASELNVSLEDIAKKNLEKLLDRQKRNLIKGSGDHR